MGKARRKALKRLNMRQERWQQMVSKMTHEQRRAYKMPGSTNPHKGS